MRTEYRVLALGVCALISQPAHVQMRPGEPATLSPQTTPQVPPLQVVGPFRDAYLAAGKPRVVLFWNLEFDGETETPQQSVAVHPPKQGFAPVNQRDMTELDTAFRSELRMGDVHFLDHDKAVRFAQAEQDRSGVDPKLIETDAVLGKADILLEVLLIRDRESPFGRGFKVVLTDVKTGSELDSFYTTAQPALAVPAGHFVGTDRGFDWQQPPTPMPSLTQIGSKLADEVMQSLVSVLHARNTTKHD